MGRFVNPDNSAFRKALNLEIYVDKTGLLEYTNLGYDRVYHKAFVPNEELRQELSKVVRRKNKKLTEVRNLCQCKTRIPLCQLFLSVQFLRLLKRYKKLYEFI